MLSRHYNFVLRLRIGGGDAASGGGDAASGGAVGPSPAIMGACSSA
jgi:hypothetical protein